jgi:hypothetical protein
MGLLATTDRVLVNTTSSAKTITATDTHAANMEIVLSRIHLGLTSSMPRDNCGGLNGKT